MNPVPTLDELDRQLIELLGRDARVSNRRIAAELNVTEGTVRVRIRRLQQEGLISFTAITNFGLADTARLAFVGVQADVEMAQDVAARIARLPMVSAVLVTMGRFTIMAVCLFDTLDHLLDNTSDAILAIPGVHHVETSIVVKTMKYNSRIGKIVAKAG